MSSKNPIFRTKDSIFTLCFVTFEAVIISILEGMVIMNHLRLVSNCHPDTIGEGLTFHHQNFILKKNDN
jgi:hypothetical protein